MWNLSSATRNWTHAPCTGRWIRNHWTAREVPQIFSIKMPWSKALMCLGVCMFWWQKNVSGKWDEGQAGPFKQPSSSKIALCHMGRWELVHKNRAFKILQDMMTWLLKSHCVIDKLHKSPDEPLDFSFYLISSLKYSTKPKKAPNFPVSFIKSWFFPHWSHFRPEMPSL